MKKTFAPNPTKVEKEWVFMDANDRVLGKLATEIAVKLIGKDKSTFSPNQNMGSKVVVTNASKVAVTGNKLRDKMYIRYTGYPKGLRTESLGELLKRRPTDVIRNAVRGMLPKNKLQDERMANLYIYEGTDHPHAKS